MAMKKVLILNGSPRKAGNTTALTKAFTAGAEQNTNLLEEIRVDQLNLKYCSGCLRCNVLGYCALCDDDFPAVLEKIEQADVLVFASPIYFHHVTAQLKKLIDRFRCLMKIRITETGLLHTPTRKWDKEVVLLFALGSSDAVDAQPAIKLFEFMMQFLSPDKELHAISATRLAVSRQLEMNEEDLRKLYQKMKLPLELAEQDCARNQELLARVREMGIVLSKAGK